MLAVLLVFGVPWVQEMFNTVSTDDAFVKGHVGRSFIDQTSGPFLQQTADPVAARQLALQTLANLRQKQASALAYFDVFWVLAVIMIVLVFVVPSMKRSAGERSPDRIRVARSEIFHQLCRILGHGSRLIRECRSCKPSPQQIIAEGPCQQR